MLSVFPELLFLSPLAPALVRLSLAVVLGYAAWRHAGRAGGIPRALAAAEACAALLLFLGAWTQPAGVLVAAIAAAWFFHPASRVYEPATMLLVAVLGFTLLITGAGAFAFDLPL